MISGEVFIVDMKPEVKYRLYNWAKNGNLKHSLSSVSMMGLNFRFIHYKDTKHILIMEHALFFNFGIFLKLYFMIMAWRIRKSYTIKTASRIDLVNYIEVKK